MKQLSFRAKGVLCWIKKHYPETEVHITELERTTWEGKPAILSALRELRAFEYLDIIRKKNERGIIVKTFYKLTDKASEVDC